MDMQLFIISPLLLLPMLHYGKKMSYIGIPAVACLIIIYTMVLFNIYNIKMYKIHNFFECIDYNNYFFRWTDDYYYIYYYPSHNRLPAWLIGLSFGAFLLDYQENKNKFQIRNKVKIIFLF